MTQTLAHNLKTYELKPQTSTLQRQFKNYSFSYSIHYLHKIEFQ